MKNSSEVGHTESVLVPELAGELTVPGISYMYYDPDREEYVEATTSPIVVSVAEAEGVPSLTPSSVGGTVDEPASTGAKPIRQVPLALRKPGGELTDSVVYWGYVVPSVASYRRSGDLEAQARCLGSRPC